jgi:ferredoxin
VLQQQRYAAEAQQRTLPGRDLQAPLFARLSHPQWQAIGERCLACGNCTAVCPTCFCHSEQEHPALDGGGSEHVREWDSCFTPGHSYIHGVVIRAETSQRYRQWLTHKLGSWHEQYGRSGCVGCGRCITWCPVGIDITEEVTTICGGDA